nr:glycosyltransferase [Paracoccus fontiphilus]
MRWAQIAPFLRDVVRAFPAGVHWLRHRDPLSSARIKTALRLNTVIRSGQLDRLLFAEDGAAAEIPPAGWKQTGITVVVPVYNAFDLLPEVLGRVLDHTDLPWRLIIVEDCSSDAQVRPWLRGWQAALAPDIAARVTVIENETNLGFIRSVNRAFAAALPFGDHVVLLNSDAFVPAGWASRLIRPLLDQENVATVTPMSNDAEIFNIPAICQREDLRPGEADAIDRVAARFRPGAGLAEAPTGVGFCMAMHVDYLRRLPDLDTVFGRGYGEEVDWCQRARQMGGRHLGLGGLFVEHRGGTSFGSAEKRKLIRKNGETISRRYPRYDAEVQDFIGNDPLNTPRLALGLAWAGSRQKGAVPVYLAHDMGGGAEHYLQDRLKSDLEADATAVVLRVGGLSRWQIELHSTLGITRGETDSTDFVVRLLDLLPARRVIYSCAVGDRDPIALPEILMSLARGPGDRIEVLMHDFFPLSPSYMLLDSGGAYHGLPMPGADTDPAHGVMRPDGTRADLGQWREAWEALLDAAHAVTVFSENSRALVAQAYPQVAGSLVVTPHRLVTVVPVVQPKQPKDGVPVIGILGNIGHQKGAGVLRALSRLLARNNRARLVVIGNLPPDYSLASPARVHGDYRIEDIPGLVSRYGIGRWLIPSIWPETFSYTTHEALATGLPVFSFDLGAQGDAVRAAAAIRGQGGTIPLVRTEADLEAMLDVILKDREGR